MSIKQLEPGLWEINVYVGPGKPRLTQRVYADPPKRRPDEKPTEAIEVEKALMLKRDQLRDGDRAYTGAEWVDHWLSEFPRPRETTNKTYFYATRRFREKFAGELLAEADTKEGRKRHRAFARTLPPSEAKVLRLMFNQAIVEDAVETNPYEKLTAGRNDYQAVRDEFVRDWSLDPTKQLEQLEEIVAAGHKIHGPYGAEFEAFVRFQAWEGDRPGEAFGLDDADIDFAREEISIYKHVDGLGKLAPLTKNGRQRKVILVRDPRLIAALKAKPRRIGQKHYFAGKRGGRLNKTTMNGYWKEVRAAIGKPEMKLYSLRHFCATQLLNMGIQPPDVAVHLGHTDGGLLVVNVYGHPNDDLARDRIRKAFTPNVVEITSVSRKSASGGIA